jgi:hypothetical protein
VEVVFNILYILPHGWQRGVFFAHGNHGGPGDSEDLDQLALAEVMNVHLPSFIILTMELVKVVK